jgi:hypothetical protein
VGTNEKNILVQNLSLKESPIFFLSLSLICWRRSYGGSPKAPSIVELPPSEIYFNNKHGGWVARCISLLSLSFDIALCLCECVSKQCRVLAYRLQWRLWQDKQSAIWSKDCISWQRPIPWSLLPLSDLPSLPRIYNSLKAYQFSVYVISLFIFI